MILCNKENIYSKNPIQYKLKNKLGHSIRRKLFEKISTTKFSNCLSLFNLIIDCMPI